ncbi:ABC transporter permease [Pseudomonas sp. PDNC002]|nr:ABC transporter permease [Pseudomonas sp. PDNC002]
MARRDVASRYHGTLLGSVWVFLAPLLMLLVYTFVFGHILKARWGGDQSTTAFALTLFSGLLLNSLLADCLGRASGVVHQHSNYVKKLVFPLETLPLSVVLAALTNTVVGYLILLLAMFLLGPAPGWNALLLPLALLPFLICVVGLACGVAALGAYFRDVGQIVQFLLVLLLFLSPVLYPLTSLPPEARDFLLLNPLTIPVETVRSVLFGSPLPPESQIWSYTLISALIALLGVSLFLRVKSGFADVL